MRDDKTTLRAFERVLSRGSGRWELRVTDGYRRGHVVELGPSECVLGKASDADIVFTDSGVSRRHAKIIASSEGIVMIVDLDSTNGTFVNGTRVEVCALRHGHRVRLGPDVELELVYVEEQVGDEADVVSLTAREAEVAKLVAAGRSNGEIAEILGIRPRTVATHLENIYRRLKVSGRVELTRRLARAGLV